MREKKTHCVNGHERTPENISKNRTCKKCITLRNKKFKENNKEYVREKSKEFYEKHKEKICERGTKYYNDNKEDILKKHKKYFLHKHKDSDLNIANRLGFKSCDVKNASSQFEELIEIKRLTLQLKRRIQNVNNNNNGKSKRSISIRFRKSKQR